MKRILHWPKSLANLPANFRVCQMIAKERSTQEHPLADKFGEAGAHAEQQMAFYLRRAFADKPEISVFNDLRLVDDSGEVAQIDHLILHRRGFIIVESKSAVGTMVINRQGEWHRLWNGRKQGMSSPIRQAQSQGKLLVKLLHGNREGIRRKALFGALQFGFAICPVDVLIAIGDKGTIERHTEVPEVFKADAVVEAIWTIVDRHKLGAWTLSFTNGMEKFNDEELERIGFFLLSRHRPLPPAKPAVESPPRPALQPPPAPRKVRQASEVVTPVIEQSATNACKHCRSPHVHVLYGKFSYYFKCLDCGKNTPIDFTCPRCAKKTAKVRKEGPRFHRECQACGYSHLLHVND